jgi:hypothetical protein
VKCKKKGSMMKMDKIEALLTDLKKPNEAMDTKMIQTTLVVEIHTMRFRLSALYSRKPIKLSLRSPIM